MCTIHVHVCYNLIHLVPQGISTCLLIWLQSFGPHSNNNALPPGIKRQMKCHLGDTIFLGIAFYYLEYGNKVMDEMIDPQVVTVQHESISRIHGDVDAAWIVMYCTCMCYCLTRMRLLLHLP